MERWLKVVLGTVFGSIGSVIFFILFDRAVQFFRRARERRDGVAGSVAVPLKVRSRRRDAREQEEVEQLVFEEFDTEKQEVLAISLETSETVVGVSLFLNDREVEYYWEQFPECCLQHDDDEEGRNRNLMTAVSHWAPKWTYAEAVNFLVSSGDLVRSISKPGTSHCRAIEKFEARYSFRFFIQWTDNYVCDEVANEELWEEVVLLAKSLLNSAEAELESAWENFPLEHWRRRRVRVRGDSFHQVLHPGEISDGTVKDETENNNKLAEPVPVTDDLVTVEL